MSEALIVGYLAAFALGGTLAGALLLRKLRLARHEIWSVRQAADQATARCSALTRLVALSVHELRQTTLRLHGQVQVLELQPVDASPAERDAAPAAIATLSRALLSLADDLDEHLHPAAHQPILHDEALPLGPLIDETVATVAATLGPSRRRWRVAAEIAGVTLRADRRAFRQVLLRTLSHAARSSGHGDWIEISVDRDTADLALIIADEGAGLVHAEPMSLAAGERPRETADSRGLGLGLTLARSLIEAHGGRLAIEAKPAIGSRVTLRLPRSRLVAWQVATT
jgi:two-component system cell cycle sensor histidine kinase PleC